MKLGDTYMIVNFFFVFGSLIEFAMVSGQEQQKLRTVSAPAEDDGNGLTARITKLFKGDIDKVARILFPFTFSLWNIIYFSLGFGLRNY